MSPSDWLQITVQAPLLLLLIVIPLVLLELILLAVYARRRWQAWKEGQFGELQELRAQATEFDEQEQELASTREAYRHFLYNASHEVANPLQSIQTNLDNMATCSFNEEGRWRQSLQILAAEVQRLIRLTESLRLLSRLETPEAALVREPVNMKAVIEDVIMTLYEAAESQSVALRYRGPQRPARVLGNRDHLRQVLMNLVDNGIKYSQPEGGQVVIAIQEVPDRLSVRVSDEGVGIPEDDLPHIFDTAYRSPDARSLRRKGSGLGLAIARQIVEQHGGEIRVHSQPGQGTTVVFDLPVHVPT